MLIFYALFLALVFGSQADPYDWDSEQNVQLASAPTIYATTLTCAGHEIPASVAIVTQTQSVTCIQPFTNTIHTTVTTVLQGECASRCLARLSEKRAQRYPLVAVEEEDGTDFMQWQVDEDTVAVI